MKLMSNHLLLRKLAFNVGIVCFLLFFPFSALLIYFENNESALPALLLISEIVVWVYLVCALYLWFFSFKELVFSKGKSSTWKFILMLMINISLMGIYGFFHYYFTTKKFPGHMHE